ncbi:MAG: SIR2 family protein [Gallionellaceae bacterium]
MNKNALLIGNDINSLSPGYDWAQLLKDLVKDVGAKNKINDLREQFPLFYEEICIYAETHGTKSENDIKRFIGNKVQGLRPNKIHTDLLNLGIKEVLTTNYEFTLEQALKKTPPKLKNEGRVSETRYSIFRHYKAKNVRFWHIHGDAHTPNSIALGYEHYSGYLQAMRNYVVSGTGDSYKDFRPDPITKKLRSNNPNEIESWLDVFFTHDVHIVGLGLDFVEIHLWWLLTFRARAAIKRSELNIQNKIYYYCPKQREDLDRTKLRFLRANNVLVQACDRPNEDKSIYYKNVIRKIKSNMKSRS